MRDLVRPIGKGSLGSITHVITSRDRSRRRKNDSDRNNAVRGREVTVTESASDGQVIYGEMRVGGVLSFIQTSSESKAYLRTGSNNNQIVWIAKANGAVGNDISVTIECYGTQGSISVSVTGGDDITVRVKSTGGTSESTAAQVIAAIQADATANALVTVHKGDGDGTGNVQAASVQSLTEGGGTWLYHYVTLACHEIDSVQAVYLDDREVPFDNNTPDPRWATGDFLNKVFWSVQLGSDSQTVQGDLQGQVGSTVWTDNDRQRGCAGGTLITIWSASLFPEGHPEDSYLVRGKKCYDFRDASTAWTQNAALIIADYLMSSKYGLGVPLADMDVDSWSDAADICDEAVSLTAGGTEPRYTINGVFDTSTSHQQILEDMAQAIAGDIVYQQGKWFCYPGKYRAPSHSFDENDLRAEVRVRTGLPRREIFNTVKGTYISPTSFVEEDYPSVTNSTFVTADGETLFANINQPFITSAAQCQRIANIELSRNRQGLEATLVYGADALNVQIGDTIEQTLDEFGWTAKEFEARDVVINDDEESGITVTLACVETAEEIYDDIPDVTVDVAPNTNLPDPYTASPPSAIELSSGTDELYSRLDGTIFSRLKVTWTEPNDVYVTDGGEYELQFKPSASSQWQNITSVPGGTNFTYILDVQDGTAYDVRIRSRNAIGVVSAYITATDHVVQGKTEPPSDVTGFEATVSDDGILLTWDQITDIDRAGYEIRFGADWDTAVSITPIKITATSFLYNFREAGALTLLIKAIDTSGNYSTNAASVELTIDGPSTPTGFTVRAINNTVLLDWDESTTGSLSIDEYDVYKGDTFETASKIGVAVGTFHVYLESQAGTFTYWVVAVDIGGNISTPVSATVTVEPTRDFFVVEERDPTSDFDSWQNVLIGGSSAAPGEDPASTWFPFPTFVAGMPMPMIQEGGPTWEEIFALHGWTNFQDAINGGWTHYLTPSTVNEGSAEWKIDLGTTFASGFLKWDWLIELLGSEEPTITPTISVSEDDVTYQVTPGAAQVFALNFRYVKLRADFSSTTNNCLVRMYEQNLKVQLERDEETGIVDVLASDNAAGGTAVFFSRPWADVEDIQLTPNVKGGVYTPVIIVRNFNDEPDPVSFRVLAFNDAGTPIDAVVAYRVRGALRPT